MSSLGSSVAMPGLCRALRVLMHAYYIHAVTHLALKQCECVFCTKPAKGHAESPCCRCHIAKAVEPRCSLVRLDRLGYGTPTDSQTGSCSSFCVLRAVPAGPCSCLGIRNAETHGEAVWTLHCWSHLISSLALLHVLHVWLQAPCAARLTA